MRSVLSVPWKNWCWSWNSNTLATSCEELTHLKRPWCWERLKVGGEGDNRGGDGWMASLTRWAWVWVNSGSWWWTGRPGMLRFMGSWRVGQDWATEMKLNQKQREVKSQASVLSCVQLFATPKTLAHQSIGFSRQEYLNGYPVPSPGDLLDPGIKSRSSALQEKKKKKRYA